MEYSTKENKPGIYKITNIINGKCYIGSSVKLRGRFRDHVRNLSRNMCKPNKRFQAAWNKHGGDNFKFEILEVVDYLEDKMDLKETLIIKEQYWVNILNPEYNMQKICVTSNYGLHWKLSESSRLKIKQNCRKGKDVYNSKAVVLLDIEGNYIQTFDTCKQCADYLNEYINDSVMVVMCCKHKCHHIKNKYITVYKNEWDTQYKNNPINIQKLVHKTTSDYRKQRQKAVLTEYYTTHEDIHKKQSQVQKRPVLQYDLMGNLIAEYDSIKGAWEHLGISRSVIGNCCRGKRDTVGEFIFKFKNGGRIKHAV